MTKLHKLALDVAALLFLGVVGLTFGAAVIAFLLGISGVGS